MHMLQHMLVFQEDLEQKCTEPSLKKEKQVIPNMDGKNKRWRPSKGQADNQSWKRRVREE